MCFLTDDGRGAYITAVSGGCSLPTAGLILLCTELDHDGQMALHRVGVYSTAFSRLTSDSFASFYVCWVATMQRQGAGILLTCRVNSPRPMEVSSIPSFGSAPTRSRSQRPRPHVFQAWPKAGGLPGRRQRLAVLNILGRRTRSPLGRWPASTSIVRSANNTNRRARLRSSSHIHFDQHLQWPTCNISLTRSRASASKMKTTTRVRRLCRTNRR